MLLKDRTNCWSKHSRISKLSLTVMFIPAHVKMQIRLISNVNFWPNTTRAVIRNMPITRGFNVQLIHCRTDIPFHISYVHSFYGMVASIIPKYVMYFSNTKICSVFSVYLRQHKPTQLHHSTPFHLIASYNYLKESIACTCIKLSWPHGDLIWLINYKYLTLEL